MRPVPRLGMASCAALLASAVWSADATPPPGPRVYVGFDTETTRVPSKDVDGPTGHGGTGAASLLPGESGVSWVFAGSYDHPDDWCKAGIGGMPAPPTAEAKAQLKEQQLKAAGTLWWADFKLVSASPEKIVLALDWERWTVQENGRRKVAGDHRTVELKSGEAHTLDFANASLSGPGPWCARNMIVRLTAGMAGDSAAARP